MEAQACTQDITTHIHSKEKMDGWMDQWTDGQTGVQLKKAALSLGFLNEKIGGLG